VVTGSDDTTAKIWDTKTGGLLHSLEGHTASVKLVAFNPTGNKILTGCSDSRDTTAKIWDTKTGELLHSLKGHTTKSVEALGSIGSIDSVVFNPTGDKIVIAHGPFLRIWDTTAGEHLFSLLCSNSLLGNNPQFNPAGDKIAVSFACLKNVRIGDLEPALSIQKFLEKNITLRQLIILNAIFETMKAQGIVKALKEKAFLKGAPALSPECIIFDINKYPHLKDDYEALPKVIKEAFDPRNKIACRNPDLKVLLTCLANLQTKLGF
jgi:WD40 repeat protein